MHCIMFDLLLWHRGGSQGKWYLAAATCGYASLPYTLLGGQWETKRRLSFTILGGERGAEKGNEEGERGGGTGAERN